jgi:2-ketoarginine methyltransferase
MSSHRTPSAQQPADERPAFDLFEGFALSSVLAGLEMAGLLESLEDGGLPEAAVLDRPRPAAELLRASLAYLADRAVVENGGDTWRLTDYGRAVCPDKGYLVWLVGGYGGPLRHLGAMMDGTATYGTDYTRDGEWVAGGAAMLGRADVVPYALDLLGGINFRHMLDIGCGNARFLLLACKRFGATGVGVDLSPEACQLAEAAAEAAGMRDRVQIALGDAADLDKIPRLGETDLVVTFFLLHEILASGRDALVAYLADLCGRLPAGARLLAAEVEPPRTPESGRVPAPQRFTPEFTYVHALMSQILYPAQEWERALIDGGFRMVATRSSGMPGGLVLLAEKPAS